MTAEAGIRDIARREKGSMAPYLRPSNPISSGRTPRIDNGTSPTASSINTPSHSQAVTAHVNGNNTS
jgi:hypothetical protein